MVENLRDCLQKAQQHHLDWSLNGTQLPKQIADTSKGHSGQDRYHPAQTRFSISRFDNGATKNIKLDWQEEHVHNKHPSRSSNQYKPEEGPAKNRYDVTHILINGLPLVYIELKRRGVEHHGEAFNQINCYQNDSVLEWQRSLLLTMCRFSSSANGTIPNTTATPTAIMHVEEMKQKATPQEDGCQQFEFTSYWATRNAGIICPTWRTSPATFFCPVYHPQHPYQILCSRRQVVACHAPYQITATEKIIQRINRAMLTKP